MQECSNAEQGDVVPVPLRVKVAQGLCEGWGECHRWAPDIYPLDTDGHVDVHVAEVPAEHALEAWLGAIACPEGVITIVGPPREYWLRLLRVRTERPAAEARGCDARRCRDD